MTNVFFILSLLDNFMFFNMKRHIDTHALRCQHFDTSNIERKTTECFQSFRNSICMCATVNVYCQKRKSKEL